MSIWRSVFLEVRDRVSFSLGEFGGKVSTCATKELRDPNRGEDPDLAEVFDPAGFNGGWALGEVERVVKALPELQLPFDEKDVAPTTIEKLDQIIFEARRRTQRLLWSTPTSPRAVVGLLFGVM